MYRVGFIVLFAALCPPAMAQLRPVVGNGATAFDPEVSVVNSGAVLDAQAVVSHDRKYVTINMAPSNSNVIAIRNFPVQAVAAATGFGGFVGGATPGGAAAPVVEGPAGGVTVAPIEPAPVIVLNPSSQELSDPKILNRSGIIRLAAP